MAAIVEAVTETVLNTLGTSHFLNVPAGVTAGDRLLAISVFGKNQLSPGTTWPGGYFELMDSTSQQPEPGVNLSMAEIEVSGSPPGTINVTSVNSVRCVGLVLRITGHDPGSHTEVSVLTNTSDPPNLAPSWGADMTLFGALLSCNEDPFPLPSYQLPNNRHDVLGSVVSLYMNTSTVSAANLNPTTWQSGSPEASGRTVVTFAVRGVSSGPDLSQIGETGSINVLTHRKSKGVAQLSATESITALTVFKSQAMSFLEVNQNLQEWAGSVKTKPLGEGETGPLVETDALMPVAVTQTLGQLLEGPAQLLPMAGGVKAKAVGQLTAAGALQALTASKAMPLTMLSQLEQLGDIGLQFYMLQLQQFSILVPLLEGSLPSNAKAFSDGLEMPVTTTGLFCDWCGSTGLEPEAEISTYGLSINASSRGLGQPIISSGMEH